MPVPVAAGSDILVTKAFPTSDTLYVFQDEVRAAPDGKGELVPPPPSAGCRASAPPRGWTPAAHRAITFPPQWPE